MAGVGSVLPLRESSSGLIFAAYLPVHLVKTWTAAHTLAYDELEPELRQIRTQGFAWVDGRMGTGLRGVSAPVLDMFGEIRCSLTLLSPDPALIQLPNEAQARLVAAGRAASLQLGNRSA
nr:IclR family transcriptional regulator C-terminal domain-containing protein [Variovorax terrae]